MKILTANLTDGYKCDHRRQYPEGTNMVYSNFTARKSRIPEINSTVFFGLQYVSQKHLIDDWNRNFFGVEKNIAVEDGSDGDRNGDDADCPVPVRAFMTVLMFEILPFDAIECVHALRIAL